MTTCGTELFPVRKTRFSDWIDSTASSALTIRLW